MTGSRFPDDVESSLREAGWESGRDVGGDVDAWVLELGRYVSSKGDRHTIFPAAIEVLREFGGLRFDKHRPGITARVVPFDLDPGPRVASASRVREFADEIGRAVYPIGTYSEASSLIVIDEDARIFILSPVGTLYAGATIDEALVNLLRGIRIPNLDDEDDVLWES